MEKHPSPARNVTIQYLRAAAALSVLLYHASARYSGAGFLAAFGDQFGVYGVSIFFAISGWLMANLVRADDSWRFLSHRIIRIYPTYILVVLILALLGLAVGVRIPIKAQGMLLVPDDSASYTLGIEWTLVFEVTYYVMLFLISLAGLTRWLERIAVAWVVAIAVALAADRSWGDGQLLALHAILLSPANAAFAGGLLLPALIRRGLVPPLGALLILPGMAAFGLFDLGVNRLISSVAAVALVGWAAQRPATKPETAGGRVLARFGDWSYALYLCHPQVILVTATLLERRFASPALLWPAVILASLAASVPLGIMDVRLYAVLKRWADRAHQSIRMAGVGLFAAAYLGVACAISATIGLVQWSIHRLGPDAFLSPQAAAGRIEAASLSADPSITGRFESVDLLPAGTLVLRGWALNRERPSQSFILRAYCNGKPIRTAVSPRKIRPDVAEALGDPSLRRRRIGFALIPSAAPPCAAGAEVFLLAFTRLGSVAVLPGTAALPGSPLP